MNVKVKHVDNVQWELHLWSSKGQKGEVKDQMHGIHEAKGKVKVKHEAKLGDAGRRGPISKIHIFDIPSL